MRYGLAVLALVAASVAASPPEGEAAWSYKGETGPEHWEQMEHRAACGGAMQSPVNIIRTHAAPDTSKHWPLELHYPSETHIHDVVNNGHTIQFDFDRGDEVAFNGERYQLKQIHFHEPAEHTLNGARYPIEMHLVHYNEALHEFTVLAVLGYEGDPSEGYQFLESFLPLPVGDTKIIDEPFDLRRLLPGALTPRYHYRGSLTTPPCTENVNWVIFEQPFMLSYEQVMALKDNMPLNNYRGVQPLNDRDLSLIVH